MSQQPARFEFWASEDGEPFCAFAYGHLPFDQVTTDKARARIMAEADVWDLDDETLEHVRELMQGDPGHHWIRQEGEFEDSPYYFCVAGAEGAVAITGWKLC